MVDQDPLINSPRQFPAFTTEELLLRVQSGEIQPWISTSMTKVFGKYTTEVYWQLIEDADKEGIPLRDYRRNEQNRLLHLLEDNDIAFLIGPSRSAKTEAILAGSRNICIHPVDTLSGRADIVFIDFMEIGEVSLEDGMNTIEDIINDSEKDPQILILDEYTPYYEELICVLVEKGYKLIISVGGRMSNVQKRIDSVFPLEEKLTKAIPVVEVGTKPLSPTQIEEMLLKTVDVRYPKELLKRLIETLNGIPVNPLALERIIRSLRSQYQDLKYPFSNTQEVRVTLEDSLEAWKDGIWDILKAGENGAVYRVEEIVDSLN